MKKIILLALSLLMIAGSAMANSVSDYFEIMHKRLDRVIIVLEVDDITRADINNVLATEYFKPDFDILRASFEEPKYRTSTDTKSTIRDKMIHIGEKLKALSDNDSNEDQITDYILHEYGCVMGGSC